MNVAQNLAKDLKVLQMFCASSRRVVFDQNADMLAV